jgi:mannose-6-phosphate isomerase-like protein (cupin superfamily)
MCSARPVRCRSATNVKPVGSAGASPWSQYMLAFYICVNLVFIILRVIRWLLERSDPPAGDPSGHPLSVISVNQPPAPPHAIVRNGKLQRVEIPPRKAGMPLCEHNVAGPFTDFEASVPPRRGSPVLLHKDHDKVFRVLEGTFRFQCAGDVFDAAPGTTVVVARSVEHSWINLGVTPGRITFTFVPNGSNEPPAETPTSSLRRPDRRGSGSFHSSACGSAARPPAPGRR